MTAAREDRHLLLLRDKRTMQNPSSAGTKQCNPKEKTSGIYQEKMGHIPRPRERGATEIRYNGQVRDPADTTQLLHPIATRELVLGGGRKKRPADQWFEGSFGQRFEQENQGALCPALSEKSISSGRKPLKAGRKKKVL